MTLDPCLSRNAEQLKRITSDQQLVASLSNVLVTRKDIGQIRFPRVAALELFLLTFCNERSSWDLVFRDLKNDDSFSIQEKLDMVGAINHTWGAQIGFFSTIAVQSSDATRDDLLKKLPLLPEKIGLYKESEDVEDALTSDAYFDTETGTKYVSMEYLSSKRFISYMLKAGASNYEAVKQQDRAKEDEESYLSSIIAFATIQHLSVSESPY
jgi:hypothetical protein